MNCNNNQNNNGCGCNCNPHPTPAPEPVDINMNVWDRNINMLPMLQTYTTKILKPNIDGCCKKNILKQCMMNCENYKYVIKWDFDLNGETITVPENCILEFDGGSLDNGTIIGQDTLYINVGDVEIWGKNLTREGTWREHSGGGGGEKDRPYDPEAHSGLGRKTLELGEDGSNILTQDDFDQENTVYIVGYEFSLGAFGTKTLEFTSAHVSSVKTDEKLHFDTATANYNAAVAGGDPDEIAAATDRLSRAQSAYDTFGMNYYYYVEVRMEAHQALYLRGRAYRLNDSKTAIVPTENGVIYTGNTAQTVIIGSLSGEYTFKYANYVTIPDGSILKFEGGSINDGVIVGTHTDIEANDSDVIFGKNIIIGGTWKVNKIFDTWFDYSEEMVSNDLIKNVLALTDNDVDNVVRLMRDTTYNVEFTPTNVSSLPTTYYLTDGTLVDEHGDPIPGSHADGSDADRARLYWTVGGTTYNISRYLAYRKYPNDDTLYQRISGSSGIAMYDPEVRDDLTLFYVKNNTKLVIDSTIQMLNHKFTNYFMFNIMGRKNITFKGKGSILGEIAANYDISYKWPYGSQNYEDYWMYYGEHAYLIMMSGAQNITIEGITLGGSAGDCIYSNPDCTPCCESDSAPNITRDIVIKDITVDRSRRNGITCCGVNVLIQNVYFKNCGLDNYGGTPPKCGIDFESDFLHPMWVNNNQTLRSIANRFFPDSYNDLGCRNVIMSDCKFDNNAHDISSTTPQYHYDTHFDFEPGAVTMENCNFTSFLRLNSTNCLRFRNCYIEKITSYDDTTDPMGYTMCLEYENCVFGDDLASRYFAYANRAIGSKYPTVRFDNCRGRTLYDGKETVYYSNLTDSVIEVRIPFVYDDRVAAAEQLKYKINRGVMHVKIMQLGALSVRTTECDIFISDFPRIYNTKYFGGEYLTAEEDSNYVGICSVPQIVTDSDNHTQYLSFYIASGDVLNRYYNYETHEWSDTPSGDRPYTDKDIIVEFDYLGVPDNRGNYIRSVRTGNWRLDLRNGIYSGMEILAGRVNPSDFSQIDGYVFDYSDWNSYTVIDSKTASGEYVTRFPKVVTNSGMPVDDAAVPNRDVYAGLSANEWGKILYGMVYSSRFNCGMMVQGNIVSRVDTSSVYFKKAMSKAELASVLMHSKYNVMFENGQQVFITDEGDNGTPCAILYNPAHLTLRFYLDGKIASDVVISQNDTIQLYFFGKVVEFNVTSGMTTLQFITVLRNAIKEAFEHELVEDITILPQPGDEDYAQKSAVGRMQVIDEDPSSLYVYVRYANQNNIFAYTGSLRIIHDVNNLSFLSYAGLTADDDFTVVKGDGTLVEKFWA